MLIILAEQGNVLGKKVEQCRAADPASTGGLLLSDSGRGLHQLVQRGLTEVLFPSLFGRGMAFLLPSDRP